MRAWTLVGEKGASLQVVYSDTLSVAWSVASRESCTPLATATRLSRMEHKACLLRIYATCVLDETCVSASWI